MSITITVPDGIARAAEAEAERTGRTLHDVLVDALEAHFAGSRAYADVDAVAGAAGTLGRPISWAKARAIAREERLVDKYRRE